MARRPRVLVTGFGPFPGVAHNPSAEVARRLAASPRWRRLGIEARAVILTTTYAALETELAPVLAAGEFEALLMIGVSGRAKRVHIERRAMNRANLLFPDAAGRRPGRLSLAAGPAHRRTLFAATSVAASLRRRGVPCVESQNAGRYLCNAAYFSALAVERPALFLHIPRWPRAAKRAAPEAAPRRRPGPERLAEAFADVAVALLRDPRLRRSGSRAEGAEVAGLPYAR